MIGLKRRFINLSNRQYRKLHTCKNCKYGDINFWGYEECSKFDQELDWKITKHTAHREKHAMIFNVANDCPYFERKRKFK